MTTSAYQGASKGAACGLSESPNPGRSIAITRLPSGARAAIVGQERGLRAAEAVQADERRPDARLAVGDLVLGGRDPAEAEPAGVGRAARRREQPDAEMKVVADAQLAAPERVHAAGEIVADPRPGPPVRGQPGVGVAVGALDPRLRHLDDDIEVIAVDDLDADPGAAAGNVDVVRIEPADQILECRGGDRRRLKRCRAHRRETYPAPTPSIRA